MEEERRARTIGVNTTQQQYSTKEDEETMRKVARATGGRADATRRDRESCFAFARRCRTNSTGEGGFEGEEREDLAEQRDALAAKETERKTREEEGEAREKAREMEVANLVAKVNQLERERAKEKEMKAESDVKVDVGKFEEEICRSAEEVRSGAREGGCGREERCRGEGENRKSARHAFVAASVAVTPTSSEEEKSEEEALKKREIESVKTENEKLKAEIETIRTSESKLREENQTLQSTASTSTQDKSASESEHKKNMDALTLELSVQSKLSAKSNLIRNRWKMRESNSKNERASAKKSVDDTIMKSENHVAELDKEISNLKAQLDLSNVEKTETTEKFELLLATCRARK